MTNLTTEEMQRIVDGAPDGATHYDIDGEGYIQVTKLSNFNYIKGQRVDGCYLEVDRNLNDLRTILAKQQEIERLKEELSTAIEIIEDSGIDYDEVAEAKGDSDE